MTWSSRIENAPKENYNPLLYDATLLAELDDVSNLLNHGALVIPVGNDNETALHLAAKSERGRGLR